MKLLVGGLRAALLAAGIGVFVYVAFAPERGPLSFVFAAWLAALAWGMRQYEPLGILGTGLYILTASAAAAGFATIASSGGAAIPEAIRRMADDLALAGLLGFLALVRGYTAERRPRGVLLGWAVLVQGLFWAWFLGGISWSNGFLMRGEVALALALLGQVTLALLFIGWLRRSGRPKLARVAAALSITLVLGYSVRMAGYLPSDEEFFDWGVARSSTGEPFPGDPGKTWLPTLIVREDGTFEVLRRILDLDQAYIWLALTEQSMSPGDSLYLEVDPEAEFAALTGVLRECLGMKRPITALNLVVQGPMAPRQWRQIVADVYPIRSGASVITLSLADEAPAGVVTLLLGPGGLDLTPLTDDEPGGQAAALHIHGSVPMQLVVQELDRLRERGYRDLTLLASPTAVR